MENYQIIKEYLKTFPEGTTVNNILANITKAEELYHENVEKKKERMSVNVGKYFFFADIDDNTVSLVRWIYKITGILELTSSINGETVLLYKADMYETGEDGIHHNEGFTLEEVDMKDAKEIDSTLYDKATELYNEMISLKA